MRILVFSEEPAREESALRAAFPADASLEILPLRGLKRTMQKPSTADMVYLNVRGIGEAGMCKHAPVLASAGKLLWGILDPEAELADPARAFFLGAKDYLGPGALRSGFSGQRLAQIRGFAGMELPKPPEPAKRFPGWDRIPEGSELAVRFCYVSVGDPEGLRERIGEKRLRKLREDFAEFMASWAAECGGIAWMRDPEGTLLLFPERDEGTSPVLAAFRMILDRALIGYEVFRLEVPLTFRFSFHAGKTVWRRPGSTGTIVSGDVNFIFHLGAKYCSDGRITLSEETESSIPAPIRDLFLPAGDFEGRRILASRRFRD
ncbi:MAG: hypothetical protein GX430_15160 [Treponema sp.]|nr:hypothetical protein [Treponema sp.]